MIDQTPILPNPLDNLSIGADVRAGLIRRYRYPACIYPLLHALERLHRYFHVAWMRHPGGVDEWMVVRVVGGDGHVTA